jgi:hypothetical protein
MSNRLHQKNHRFDHHSLRPEQARNPKYPDAGYDPIASFESPFKGEFYTHGDIITTKSVSATQHAIVGQDLSVGHDAFVDHNLSVSNDLIVENNLTINGNLFVQGETSQIDTVVHITSAVDITNSGSGPALRVEQSGFQPIAHFIDSNGEDIIFDDNGKVGLGTYTPYADLHLKREGSTPEVEFRIQNTYELGRTILNLAGPVSESDGCLIQYTNSNHSVLLKNKHISPTGPAFTIETQAYQSIVVASNGNVAIGPILAPPEALTVLGNLSATGNLYGNSVSVSNINAGSIVASNRVVAPLLSATLLSASNIGVSSLSAISAKISALSAGSLTISSLSAKHIYTPVLNVEVITAIQGWNTATITASATTQLVNVTINPVNGEVLVRSDLELATSSDVVISSFIGGVRGLSYTLTNASTNMITITSSPTVFVRNGSAWRSNTRSLSTAFIQLPPGHSCSLRAASNDRVSVW